MKAVKTRVNPSGRVRWPILGVDLEIAAPSLAVPRQAGCTEITSGRDRSKVQRYEMLPSFAGTWTVESIVDHLETCHVSSCNTSESVRLTKS
jgi:hypothetical protein